MHVELGVLHHLDQFGPAWRRLHADGCTHEEGIVEMLAQSRKGHAHGRLAERELLGRSGHPPCAVEFADQGDESKIDIFQHASSRQVTAVYSTGAPVSSGQHDARAKCMHSVRASVYIRFRWIVNPGDCVDPQPLTHRRTVGYNSHGFNNACIIRASPRLKAYSMRRYFPIAALATALLGGAAPSFAHHSFAAEFDGTKPVTLKGKVTEFEWVNPHSWVHVDVTDDKGNTVNWACETAPPNMLY